MKKILLALSLALFARPQSHAAACGDPPQGILGNVNKGDLKGWLLDPDFIIKARNGGREADIDCLTQRLVAKACSSVPTPNGALPSPNALEHRRDSLTAFLMDKITLKEIRSEHKVFFSDQCRIVVQQKNDGLADQSFGHFEATVTGFGDSIDGRVPGEGLSVLVRSGDSKPSLHGQYVGKGMYEYIQPGHPTTVPFRHYLIDGSNVPNKNKQVTYEPPPFLGRFLKAVNDQITTITEDLGLIEPEPMDRGADPQVARYKCPTEWLRTPVFTVASWIPEDIPPTFFTDYRATPLDLLSNRAPSSYSDHADFIAAKEYKALTIAQFRVCLSKDKNELLAVEMDTRRSSGYTKFGSRNIEALRKKIGASGSLELHLRALELLIKASGSDYMQSGVHHLAMEAAPFKLKKSGSSFSLTVITTSRIPKSCKAVAVLAKLVLQSGQTKLTVPYLWHALNIEAQPQGSGGLKLAATLSGSVFPKHTLFLDGRIKGAIGPQSLSDFLDSGDDQLGKPSPKSFSLTTASREVDSTMDMRPTIEGVEMPSKAGKVLTYLVEKDYANGVGLLAQ